MPGVKLAGYTDANGDTTSFTYNVRGRLTTVTDPVGRVTTFTYDASGDQLVQLSAPGSVIQFEYSPATDIYRRHAITRVIYPDGNSTNNEYDSLGGLSRRSLNGTSEAVTYVYNSGVMTATDAPGPQQHRGNDAVGRHTHHRAAGRGDDLDERCAGQSGQPGAGQPAVQPHL